MTTPSNKPTHRILAVTRRGEKSYWQDIGCAWTQKDGKGFSLKLEYLPLNGGDIMLREADAADASTADQANASQTQAA
ncbi:MAG: hypothetical protein AB7L90_24445 [Hyphomicrobiaceae bacterium]